jgi:hypothetical protein
MQGDGAVLEEILQVPPAALQLVCGAVRLTDMF